MKGRGCVDQQSRHYLLMKDSVHGVDQLKIMLRSRVQDSATMPELIINVVL
jgi:hypothetical protein